MQFYRDGYRPGNPDILPASGHGLERTFEVPAEVDVLIVGTGPAGTVLGAQLAASPGISTRIVERRGGPLEVGQADGVSCRTVEMFQAFWLAEILPTHTPNVQLVHWQLDGYRNRPQALDRGIAMRFVPRVARSTPAARRFSVQGLSR